MKREVENKLYTKMLKVRILLLICFVAISGCKTYKDTFIDQYGDEVLYKEEYHCNIFKYNKYIKKYNSKKCFNIKYNFNEVEYNNLKRVYYKVNNFKKTAFTSKKSLKSYPYYKVFRAINKYNDTLTKSEYGLYYVSGKSFAPNFFFLRTEKNIYYYNCEEKNVFIEKLNESRSINQELKNKINHFIQERCNTEDGLKWNSGARFY